jgi:hypothetical protein
MSSRSTAAVEERSLELHRAVAERLRSDAGLLERARQRVRGWLRDESPAHTYARAWNEVLERPLGEIVAVLTDTGERARALRKSSPFAGAIEPRTRWEIWRRVADRRRAS